MSDMGGNWLSMWGNQRPNNALSPIDGQPMYGVQPQPAPTFRGVADNVLAQYMGTAPRGVGVNTVLGFTEGPAALARMPAAEMQALRQRMDGQYPGTDMWFSQAPAGHLVVDKVVVPAADRGRGVGSAVMQDLTAEADKRGLPMALTPDGAFGGNVSRLREFYSRFGFVPNAGRAKDFEIQAAMVRPARGER